MRKSAFLAAVVFGSLALPAVGGEYTDSTGFSFTYPDDWSISYKFGSAANAMKPPGEVEEQLKKHQLDQDALRVILVRNSREELTGNLNVVVEPEEMPITETSLQTLKDKLPQEYLQKGITLQRQIWSIQEFGSNKAIVFEFDRRQPGPGYTVTQQQGGMGGANQVTNVITSPDPIRQKQIFFSGGGKTYIVSCTATTGAYRTCGPQFQSMLESFKIPPPTVAASPNGGEWDRTRNTILAGIAIGGAVGLVSGAAVVLLFWVVKKRKGAS